MLILERIGMNRNKRNEDKQMKVVGVTGGVGSGKSEVLRVLEEQFNCGIIRTDDVARDLCEPGQISYELIVKEFGQEILDSDLRLDRPKLASIVFSDEEKLVKVGLQLPFTYKLQHELIKSGYSFNLVMSTKEMVKEICQLNTKN